MQDEEWKSLKIFINSSTHAELRLKLRYDSLSQNQFLKLVIAAYIEGDEDFRRFIDKMLEAKTSKRSKVKKRKDRKEAAQNVHDFALSDEEISNIFDLLEKESDNL